MSWSEWLFSLPLSYTGSGTFVFNILMACDDCRGERAGSTWETIIFGGWGGNESQSWWWIAGWWTRSYQPSLAGGSGHIDTWGGTGMPKRFWCAWKCGLSGQVWRIPWHTRLKKPTWKIWFNSWGSTSKCMENRGLLWPLYQFPLPLLPLPLLSLLKNLIL
jgi:hypothetical protein